VVPLLPFIIMNERSFIIITNKHNVKTFSREY